MTNRDNTPKVKEELAFKKLRQEILKADGITEISYLLPYPKHNFLKYLVENGQVLLHGSPEKNIDILEPRQANCRSKKFGNLQAVYAVKDPILATFYAIRDVKGHHFKGAIQSGRHVRKENGAIVEKSYRFKLHPDDLAAQPWTAGMVYILPQETFQQGENETGNPIDEWASLAPVRPIAKLPVTPEDFPLLDRVEAYKV